MVNDPTDTHGPGVSPNPPVTAAPVVTVDLEALCILIEQAQRLGVYGGTPAFDAYVAMPPEVHDRLIERQQVRTERLLESAAVHKLHEEGKPHDAALCTWCLTHESNMRRATRNAT